MANKKFLLFPLLLLLLSSFAFASPDVNLLSPQSGETYVVGSTITIDFNVWDADNNRLLVDINYSATASEGTGTVIAHDVNLTADYCTVQDWSTAELPSTCSYSWNTTGVPAGCYTTTASGSLTTTACNYYILISVDNSALESPTDFSPGSSYITITKTSDVNVNISNIGTLMNNSLQLGEKVMEGVKDQGSLMGLAIGLTIAIVLLITLIFSVIKIIPRVITSVKRLK